jgi:hypothetical protein
MFSISDALTATQDYLRSGKTLEQFEAEHGIRGKTDGRHLILDYDQLSVKWTEPYGYVCRGLVLNAATFNVLAFGLAKFFNFGEHYAAPIDWESAYTFEKIDGTMVNRWWSPHTQRFEYTTRFQLPIDIDINTVNSGAITWGNLIDHCMETLRNNDGFSPLDVQPRHETWTFEVCSRHNMVVVQHAGFSAKLLAVRNRHTLEEMSVIAYSSVPKHYRFSNGAEVAEFANDHAATDLEGFVVVDRHFNRVKIKSDQYVTLHRMKDGLKGINNLILLARTNDYEEVTTHFPEYRDDLDTVSKIINEVIGRHEVAFLALRHIESQKEFAIAVNGLGLEFTGSLFTTRSGKSKTVREAFLTMTDTGFCKLFKSRARKALGNKYADDKEWPDA